MSQARTVREILCAYVSVCLQPEVPVFVCLLSNRNHVTEVGRPKVRETRTECRHVK